VVVVSEPARVADALRLLRGEPVLGFDTETRPSFHRGEAYPPALVQLAGRKVVVLFQLGRVGLPEGLKALLSDPAVVKAGVAVARDVKDLVDFSPFEPRGFVDLAEMAEAAGLKARGLRGLAEEVLGLRVAKGQRTTNWARHDLSPAQVAYAATDAFLGRALYLELRRRLSSRPRPEA
jgi:ribonuclease D